MKFLIDSPAVNGTAVVDVREGKMVIVFGDQVRLTPNEIQDLAKLTRADPSHIRTRAQLERFVQTQLEIYGGDTSEEKLLRALIEDYVSKL